MIRIGNAVPSSRVSSSFRKQMQHRDIPAGVAGISLCCLLSGVVLIFAPCYDCLDLVELVESSHGGQGVDVGVENLVAHLAQHRIVELE